MTRTLGIILLILAGGAFVLTPFIQYYAGKLKGVRK